MIIFYLSNIILLTLTTYFIFVFFNKETDAKKQKKISYIISVLVFIYLLINFLESISFNFK